MQQRDDWNHYEYLYGEEHLAKVDFDVMAAVMPKSEGTGVRVLAPVELEESVQQLLNQTSGLWVAQMHYGGKVEWVIQTEHGLSDEETKQLKELGATVFITKGWMYFTDRVSPKPKDWRRIEDREILERLDLDGDGELRVLHNFFGDSEPLTNIRALLEREGFELVNQSDTRLTMAFSHEITDISTITVGLLRLCEHHGLAYDGWVLPG